MSTIGRQWTLRLPLGLEVINANERGHWTKNARRAAALKAATYQGMRGARIPRLERCCVALHMCPPTNRRRDNDNLVLTLKPICDGMSDEGLRSLWPTPNTPLTGIVPDDTEQYMCKTMPTIGAISRTGWWDLTVIITAMPAYFPHPTPNEGHVNG